MSSGDSKQAEKETYGAPQAAPGILEALLTSGN
jgi:hypothetical protein